MTMTDDVPCPDCERPMAQQRPGVYECYQCNERHEVGQCEHCGDRYAEAEMRAESAPGATLWFCPDCAVGRRRWA